MKIAFLNDSLSHYFILFYLQKGTFRKTAAKKADSSSQFREPCKLQQMATCRCPSESGHSCFVFPWKKRHKLLRRNFRYTHNPHATSQQHGATRMRYCSRLKREFHNHGLSLKQFSGLAFAIRNWCLAPSLLCLIWVFSQGFGSRCSSESFGFPTLQWISHKLPACSTDLTRHRFLRTACRSLSMRWSLLCSISCFNYID